MLKRKKKKRSSGLLHSKNKLVVFIAAAMCVAVIVIGSLLSSSKYQPISYVPREEGLLLPRPGMDAQEQGAEDGVESDTRYNNEIIINVPDHLGKEEKLALFEIKYRNLFGSLQNNYQRELSRLMDSAKKDYIASVNGQKDISISRLVVEYASVGRQMEKEADQNFNKILGEMKVELRSHDLPLEMAKQAEREYKEQKNRLRRDVLQQVASYVND